MCDATCRWATADEQAHVELGQLEAHVHEPHGGELRAPLAHASVPVSGADARYADQNTSSPGASASIGIAASAASRSGGTPGTPGIDDNHALTAAAAKQPASHACSPAPPISQSTSQTRGAAPRDEHVLPPQVPVDELVTAGRREG